MTFLWKTPEAKRLAEIFCVAFLIFKKLIHLSRQGVISDFLKEAFLSTSRED
jgi:hypothetical protein